MRRRIVVLEDNADNLLLLHAMLDDLYELETYQTGQEALAGLRRARPPDLVLLDVLLPGMDGIEVVRHIRADRVLADVPVVALTARAMAGDREALLAAGFDEYIARPIVDEQILLDAIARVLGDRGAA